PGARQRGTVMGPLCARTYLTLSSIWSWAEIGPDVMLVSLQSAMVLNPTNTEGVAKSPARLVAATESTAARARIERAIGGISLSAYDAQFGEAWLDLDDLPDGATTGQRPTGQLVEGPKPRD